VTTPEGKGMANKVVDAILFDLTDRRGIKNAWHDIDDDIQEEIKAKWAAIIAKSYPSLVPRAALEAWRDIESAPRDGAVVQIGWWDKTKKWQTRMAWWETATMQHGDFPGWTDWACRSFGYEEVEVYTPTHWMPLPAPPARAALNPQ